MLKEYRTHNCGSLNKTNLNQEVVVSGWINEIRSKKFAIFFDLRDSSGLVQIIVKKDHDNFNSLKTLKVESVIQITGKVVLRHVANPKLDTGEIEIVAADFVILNHAQDVPFVINDEQNFTALEDLRLKYRYLDLRRKPMYQQLKFKHRFINSIRNFLNHEDFLEIDTPCLTKSTPEGARDFLVPARIKKNSFYALPQSPQLYKQLLMISGIDKYYQIAKCFRDEDFRSDRQPEFQQLDLEMAFANQTTVMKTTERLLASLWKDLALKPVKFPLLKLSYQDVINNYGSDKPDLRCTCKITNFSFLNKDDLVLKGFWVNDKFNDTNKKAILRIVEQHQGKSFLVYDQEKQKIIFSTNNKFSLNEAEINKIGQSLINKTDKLCYLTYESNNQGAIILGAIRTFYCLDPAKQKQHQDFLTNINTYQLLWVTDWPMFEINNNKLAATHHPFTSPMIQEQVLNLPINNFNLNDLLKINSTAYDLVLNGHEIGGGSTRIFNKSLQEKIFAILGIKKSVVAEQFGFFLTAFDYGIPPHSGIAFGIDRFIMALTNSNSIRDSIAFPKNNSGIDLLTNAPSVVDIKQLDDLGLKILNDKK